MNILAIETATESCSVALSRDGRLTERSSVAPRQHASLLLPWVEALLAEADVRLEDLDALAFSRGPGSFTSLRIGIGVTQGLAWGAGLPVIPVSSLQSAAQAAANLGLEAVVVALDARMEEVFWGCFERDADGLMQPAGEERVTAPGEVVLPGPGNWSAVGNGFDRFDELKKLGSSLESVHAELWPQAAAMIPLAIYWAAHHALLPAEQAQPVYLRDKVAEKPEAG